MVESGVGTPAEGPGATKVFTLRVILERAKKIRRRLPVSIAPMGWRDYLRLALILAATGVVAWHLYLGIFRDIGADAVGNALGSMSVVGSIITGLCITGVSAMDGGLLKRLTRTYGEHLRVVFFAWFTFVSAILIASGVLHAIPDHFFSRLTAAFLPPVLFVAVTGLAFSVFKLFRVEDEIIRSDDVGGNNGGDDDVGDGDGDGDNSGDEGP